ncbi:hypothetical protein ABFY53_26240 [Serratia nematodiphila]
MQQLNLSLQEIQVDCANRRMGRGTLPVRAAQRRERHHVPLKNVGAAIAEPLSAQYPF